MPWQTHRNIRLKVKQRQFYRKIPRALQEAFQARQTIVQNSQGRATLPHDVKYSSRVALAPFGRAMAHSRPLRSKISSTTRLGHVAAAPTADIAGRRVAADPKVVAPTSGHGASELLAAAPDD